VFHGRNLDVSAVVVLVDVAPFADSQRHGGPQRQRHGEPDGRACPYLPGERLVPG
jgi:hypothetical protein